MHCTIHLPLLTELSSIFSLVCVFRPTSRNNLAFCSTYACKLSILLVHSKLVNLIDPPANAAHLPHGPLLVLEAKGCHRAVVAARLGYATGKQVRAQVQQVAAHHCAVRVPRHGYSLGVRDAIVQQVLHCCSAAGYGREGYRFGVWEWYNSGRKGHGSGFGCVVCAAVVGNRLSADSY